MVSLNERHPVEHVIGFIGVVIFHLLVIWLLVVFLSTPKKEQAETLPVQVQVIDVASSASSSASAQPPAPEMIVPPPPEIEPPPINTEAPPQPKPPPVVKKKQVKKRPPVTPPAHSQPAAQPEANSGSMAGTQGQGQSNAGLGKPDRSAGSRPLNGAQIEYPPDMEAAQKEGRVILSCDVETDGSTSNCHVISSSGGMSFTKAALKYVNSARYRPATKNGAPVKELGHRYTINFRL
ncbi:Periplasmic protein TonB [Commensalibacter communis]|uniref:energy transducer TonB n=1 Tax=Commensalibacter communis TaxID=2972786 RepID=UPI0022FFBEBA|nr:energy transducer TonB [Commensalibacter communis]CAI3952096.1 Periplasmic protein TonB [Commensalibacter communis]CAI3952351.1 Periplasmic protein TonB [Commensalibacter communis]